MVSIKDIAELAIIVSNAKVSLSEAIDCHKSALKKLEAHGFTGEALESHPISKLHVDKIYSIAFSSVSKSESNYRAVYELAVGRSCKWELSEATL